MKFGIYLIITGDIKLVFYLEKYSVLKEKEGERDG